MNRNSRCQPACPGVVQGGGFQDRQGVQRPGELVFRLFLNFKFLFFNFYVGLITRRCFMMSSCFLFASTTPTAPWGRDLPSARVSAGLSPASSPHHFLICNSQTVLLSADIVISIGEPFYVDDVSSAIQKVHDWMEKDLAQGDWVFSFPSLFIVS